MVCLAIKPVVDGLEREFEGKAYVVVFDRSGKVVFRRNGSGGVPLSELRRALRA